jgi:hypothetical protein
MSLADRIFAEPAEEQAVLAPIHAMFDGMSKRDARRSLRNRPCSTWFVSTENG